MLYQQKRMAGQKVLLLRALIRSQDESILLRRSGMKASIWSLFNIEIGPADEQGGRAILRIQNGVYAGPNHPATLARW
jgi:hypothetical protein